MFEAKCYDTHGNSIDGFTQWDADQSMVIKLESCDDVNHIDPNLLSVSPEVHFSNVKRDKALVVRASVIRSDEIFVKVPNILLTEPYPLLIYVYYTDSVNTSSQATIVRTELPVRKRNEPHDYYYVENIERITAEQIKDEIHGSLIENEIAQIEEDLNNKVDTKLDSMQGEINAFAERVGNVETTNAEIIERMDEIDASFDAAETTVAQAVEDVNTAISDIADVREFMTKAEEDGKVYYVEDQTLHANDLEVTNNIAMGNFIWVNGVDGNMSLKWIGGDV